MNKNKIFDHIYDGYDALSQVILTEDNEDLDTYELGYLDGYADAMNELGWATDGNPLKPKHRFELFGGCATETLKNAQRLKKEAKKILKKEQK